MTDTALRIEPGGGLFILYLPQTLLVHTTTNCLRVQ